MSEARDTPCSWEKPEGVVVGVTEMCRRCGHTTTEWTAVMAVRTVARLDEIEIADADPLTILCPSCATHTEPSVRLAVASAITA